MLDTIERHRWAILCGRITLSRLNVSVVRLMTFQRFEICSANRLKDVFTSRVDSVNGVRTLLRRVISSFRVKYGRVRLQVPNIRPIRFTTRPNIRPQLPFFQELQSVSVRRHVVSSFHGRAITALFRRNEVAAREHPSANGQFSQSLLLSVGVSTKENNAILSVPWVTGTPRLASCLIQLSTVLRRLAKGPPVPMIFRPNHRAVFVASVPWTTSVVMYSLVYSRATRVPGRAIKAVLTPSRVSFVDKGGQWQIVTMAHLRFQRRVINGILSAHFMAVLCSCFPADAIFDQGAAMSFARRDLRVHFCVLTTRLVCLRSNHFKVDQTIHRTHQRRANARSHPFSHQDFPSGTISLRRD